jgi:hypothetical protein
MFDLNQPAPSPQPQPQPTPSSDDRLAPRDKNFNLKDALSVDAFGGKISPAKVGRGYGLRFEKKFSKGGKVNSASSRADGIAQRGKTRGKMR